jgi:hypothetical protein
MRYVFRDWRELSPNGSQNLIVLLSKGPTMRNVRTFIAIPIIALVAGCSNTGANFQPVIDGPVGPNYNQDLAACQNLAARQGAFDSNTAGAALAGAGIAATGTAIFNNRGTNVRDAAAVGALAGVTAGALQQNSNKETIIRNCMRQRGYNVVG